jgi:fructokinase
MRIGVDLGGTKIEAIALGPAGEVVDRQRVATPSGDYAGTLAAVAGLVRAVEEGLGHADNTIGIATPGALEAGTGRLKNSNSTCLNGQTLHADLEAVLHRPIRLANDANCFALSEAVDGAAAGAGVVFGVIVGTGTGGGVVVHGRVLTGPNAIAGEWGHNPLPWPRGDELPGRPCYCGKSGCIETWLSGPGFLADHRLHGGQGDSAQEVVAQAMAGDALAQDSLQRYEDRMARALASVINLLDPHVIVLGGGMSNIQRLYQNVPKRWGAYVFSPTVKTRLVSPQHGDSSGVRGAAWLWDDV